LPHLQILVLTGCPVTDQGLRHLRELKDLRKLAVGFTLVTRRGIDDLRKYLPSLNALTNREEPD
jgi:hypothetical protein